MAIFTKSKRSAKLSVPVADSVEARWKREEVAPFSGFSSPMGRDGELALDVYMTPTHVVVRTAMAGVSPEDVNIALHNDLLTIRGERREDERVLSDQYVVQECHWGSFSRSVVLPVPVRSDGTTATMKNGILKVILERVPSANVEVRVTDDY